MLFVHNIFKNSKFSKTSISRSGLNQGLFTSGKLANKFDLIVASDIHRYQEICDGLGFYTSSPIPLDFGERNKQHGYHVVDIENNTRYFIIPRAPKFVYMNINDIDKTKVADNILKIFINNDEEKQHKQEVYEDLMRLGARYVTFKDKTKRTVDIEEEIPDHEEDVNVETIVTDFSKILAGSKKLKEDRLEMIGLEILNKARSE